MLNAEESQELRALQSRAYARDGGLSADDAARLRELEDRRRERAPEPPIPPTAPEVPVDDAPVDGAVHSEPAAAEQPEDDASAPASEQAPATVRTLIPMLRSHWRPFVLAVAALLVIGVGVGWLAFGRSGEPPVALTSEQQGWQDELVSSGTYDAGSLRALAVEEGAVVWTATKDARERTCLILGTGTLTMPSCERTETVKETGIYGSITVRSDEEMQRQLSVQMLFTASGEPAVAMSAYDYDPGQSGITYANAEESAAAERLTEEGFDPGSLWVVGYDGDVPIWTALQTETQNQCLIYGGSDADSPMTCADPETMQEQPSSLVLSVVDADTGDLTQLELATNSGPGYLVITRGGGVAGAGGD